jgi:ABC-type antimicrobial peptide transport system permease subunit
LLTLISWIIGILISLLITLVVSATWLMWDNLQLSISGVTWWLTVSILTWVIFGIIPARKAALMKLVDALRFE